MLLLLLLPTALLLCPGMAAAARMAPALGKTGPLGKTLPARPLIVGYANWNQCDEKIVDAVRDGVNVVIWFSVNLLTHPVTGLPNVQGGPDLDCVADRVREIRALDGGHEVVHLLSCGGWNSPHPDTSNSAEAIYEELNRWNRLDAARPEKGFFGFDGFDWDIEGNDDKSSPYNYFTKACLDTMGIISILAKQDGYLIAMAPAESYLDPHTSLFDRKLTHTYSEWKDLQPGFNYHGRNVYAYLVSKYGLSESGSPTFDFIMVQLYEGYSHTEYNLTVAKTDPAKYITDLVSRFQRGWTVPFSTDVELDYADAVVSVKPAQLVIGLANGWAGDGKFLFIAPDALKRIYAALQSENLNVRGFGFWNILDEGKASPSDPTTPVWLAKALKDILTA